MRALLVVNPHATTTTAAGRDVIARAMAGEVKLDVLETERRGHAAEAADQAARDGIELVVAHGGDGTVNEVVNGVLAATGGRPGEAVNGPLVGIVPGGSANVFARALGIPTDPMAATARLLESVERRANTLVALGHAQPDGAAPGRWFTFNAGLGWDAEVVAAVERARAAGHEASPLRYAAMAVRQYLDQRRTPRAMTIEIPGAAAVDEVRAAFVSTTDTWTYLGSRAVRTNPGTALGAGLGVFGLRDMGLATISATLHRILQAGGDPRGRHVLRQDSVANLQVSAAEPVALQLDGEYLGEHRHVQFRAVTGALRVVS
ncbi:MAG TPA: diacylglycerol kinase family protein [Pseudonocardia sp.]